MIELIPRENFSKVSTNISDLPNINRYENGFLEIKVRDKHNFRIEDREILFIDILEDIKSFSASYFQNVQTGYSSFRELKPLTVAFGFNKSVLFIERTDNGIVKNIWIGEFHQLNITHDEVNLLNLLNIIGVKYKLLLVDWLMETIVDLTSVESIKEYLNDKLGYNLK